MSTVTTDNGANTRSSSGALSPTQVRAYAYAAGFRGDALNTIVKIVGAESAYIPTNRYDPGPQEDSRGLAQINIAPTANPEYAGLNLYDPLTNLKVAYQLSDQGTNFSDWTTYTSGRYLTYSDGASGSTGSGIPSTLLSAAEGAALGPAGIVAGATGVLSSVGSTIGNTVGGIAKDLNPASWVSELWNDVVHSAKYAALLMVLLLGGTVLIIRGLRGAPSAAA